MFKYTIGGTYVGSWTISTSGTSSPTGITLNPSNPTHLWIVDSGTAKVYQYDNAAGLTSGSKFANSSWALAAGNTTPQGIADPPPPASSSIGKAINLQSPGVGPVPMPVFSGQPSTLATVTLQQVPSKVRSTDDFMSLLGLPVKQPTASLSVDRMLTVESKKSIDRNTRVDVEFQDDNIEDLIGLVANDLCK